MTTIREFNDNEELRKIRKDILNPLSTKVVGDIDPRLKAVENDVKRGFKDAQLDVINKKIVLSRSDTTDPTKELDLSLIIPDEFSGIHVAGSTGASSSVKAMTFPDSSIKGVSGSAEVKYDWDLIVPSHQEALVVSIGDDKPNNAYGAQRIKFTGDTSHITGDVAAQLVTIDIPTQQPPLTGDPGTGTTHTVRSIRLEGNTGGSKLEGDTLVVDLPTGGGGGPSVVGGNFQGFFDDLGDLISTVPNPVNGKSFAFVKDKTLSNNYYDAYMFIANNWTEVPIDPGLTYEDPTAAHKQGVFSIKPNPAISLDSKGQLNLDKLAESGNFHGFFGSQAELERAVPNPISDRSFGYIRMASGSWMGRRYNHNTSTGEMEWVNTVPMGATPVVTKGSGGADSTIMAYGFKNNSMIDVDINTGLVEIKEGSGGGELDVEIAGDSGISTNVKVKKVRYERGISYVEYKSSDKSITINPAQRVISYDSQFEDDHEDSDFEGNIFYDKKTGKWMGMTPKNLAAGENKWTHIAHRGMSDEVSSLIYTNPRKIPEVTPGGDDEATRWNYSGLTYLNKDDQYLPDDLEDKCGGFVKTHIKEDPADPTSIKIRTQTLIADDGSGRTYVRAYDDDKVTTGSKWTPWIRNSFDRSDMNKHENDPNAHRHVMKFYKATSFSAKYLDFINQQEGSSAGGVRGENCSLIADNYGHFNEEHDYMEPPYDNTFRVGGQIALSGYQDSKKDYPVGAWKILVRIKKKDTSDWRPAGHFNYAHSDGKKKYPLLSFETNELELVRGDQIIINITFDNNNGIRNNHPDLYFVPIRSHFYLEDVDTHAGSRIARTFSKCVANVDTMGDVGVRVHHSTPSKPDTNIRVYGEIVSHIPVEMSKI